MPRSLSHHASALMKRGNIKTDYGSYIVYGIQRVAFRADIETTNLFVTSIVSFYVVMAFTAIIITLFKGACELAAKARWIKGDTFLDFRNGWSKCHVYPQVSNYIARLQGEVLTINPQLLCLKASSFVSLLLAMHQSPFSPCGSLLSETPRRKCFWPCFSFYTSILAYSGPRTD
jgi:hypothetical protein